MREKKTGEKFFSCVLPGTYIADIIPARQARSRGFSPAAFSRLDSAGKASYIISGTQERFFIGGNIIFQMHFFPAADISDWFRNFPGGGAR
ncbi:MAG: hypothetical protein ACYS8W_13970, partial [Planctomycetota bacterium]